MAAVQQTDSVEGVTAEYHNGILRIDLPKREEVKAQRIEIIGENSGESRGTRTIQAQAGKAPANDKKARGKTSMG